MNTAIGAKTDVGRTREVNEDSYLVQEPLFVVADGMGGHVAGDVASRTVVEKLTEDTHGRAPAPADLSALVLGANAAVFNKARSDSTLQGMGTTCTLLLLEGTDAHLAHVGDSRAYLFRNNELQQITEDHTLVQRMVKEGRLSQEEAHRHPQRNIITRVLGVDADVPVDTFSVEAKPGDRFLLCSDGLSSMLEDSDIEEVLRSGDDVQITADRLVELANEAGGEDNITVVIVEVGTGATPPGEVLPSSETATPMQAGRGGAEDGADSESASAGAQQVSTRSEARAGETAPPGDASSVTGRLGSGRSWARALVGVVLIVGILVAAAYIGLRYLWIEKSFYVGVNDSGIVTIYRGVPQDVAGMTLHREEEVTSLAADDLPEFLQDDLTAGIEVPSLDEAEQRVADLEERAVDAEFERPEGSDDDGQRNDGTSGGKKS